MAAVNPLFAQDRFYWDKPQTLTDTKLDSSFPKSISNNQDSYIIWQEVDSKNHQISLNLRHYFDLVTYEDTLHFAGPFPYSGEIPEVYSATINKNGTIAVAAYDSMKGISVYTSSNKGKSFERKQVTTNSQMVAPRIYVTREEKFKLFTSVVQENEFLIYSADSPDGKQWSTLEAFAPVVSMTNPFIPVLIGSEEGDIVVFQSQYQDPQSNSLTYQLYMTIYNGESKSWSSPKLITDASSFKRRTSKKYTQFHNQVPVLHNYNGNVYLAWERTENRDSKICVAQINKDGIIPGTVDEFNNKGSRAIFFDFKNELYITWFDTNTAYYAKRNNNSWKETLMPSSSTKRMFFYPLLLEDNLKPGNKVLTFIYQNATSSTKNAIAMLGPDRHVDPPKLKALSYTVGKRSNKTDVQIQIDVPKDDPSGIKAYSYSWSQTPGILPEKIATNRVNNNKISVKADLEDGEYYLTAIIQDNADNWSEPVTIKYFRDTTPPLPPEIALTNLDKNGLLKSNTYSLNWLPSVDEDTAGYVYRIDYLGEIPSRLAVNSRHPLKISDEQVQTYLENFQSRYEAQINRQRKMSDTIQTYGLSTPRRYNQPNGVYVLSVAAIDTVGNLGIANTKMFVLNKYEPSTKVNESAIELKSNELGQQIITIHGSGFTYDGTISEIYIDKDGKEPYDLVLKLSEGDFKVQSDTVISDVNLGSNLDEGSYRIILNHTDRGLYKTGQSLKIAQNGTLKIEGPYNPPKHLTSDFKKYKYKLSVYIVILILIMLLGAITLGFVFSNLNKNIYDSSLLKGEVISIMSGAPMPGQKKKDFSNKNKSLRGRLMAFTLLLIFAVVVGVSITTGYRNIKQQEATTVSGLLNRAELLLESVNTSVNNFLPGNNTNSERELRRLPAQKNALDEAKYITIIGQPANDPNSDDYTYYISSNDPKISEKVDGKDISYRKSKVTDETLLLVVEQCQQLNRKIQQDQTIVDTAMNIRSPALREENYLTQAEYENALDENDKNQRDIMTTLLSDYSVANQAQIPEFNVNNIRITTTQYDYIFYRPVIYFSQNSNTYVRAVIILELSIENLVKDLQQEVLSIIIRSIIVALIAVILGAVGAFIFASMIVKPIKKLENHVIKIGQTRKKKDIKEVEIKSKDEIGRLGDAINKMTQELQENEVEQNLLIDGADVQNSLTPLEKEQTYADYEDDFIIASGYYQAQTGVSGDYFDYHKLDDEWYSFIKSDASGHGAPAAIIATGVAVIYREYFDNWTFKKNGTNINVVVERINDFINNWHLRGKFSTLLVGIFNKRTGDVYMCNAGDNLVHIYEQKTQAVKTLKLKETPTAGPFDTFMVNMKGGFIVEKAHLEHGDVLFLYTDGIEEATRRLRFADFSVQQSEETVMQKNPETGKPEEVIKKIDIKEDFGPERVLEVIEALFNKKKFILTKDQNPIHDESLEFDFTNCEGTLHEVIFALASTEKVFRMYKVNQNEPGEYITVDKNIDMFLEKYFNLYQNYAGQKMPSPDKANFVDYVSVHEDEQGDDLTLLAFQRK